MATGPSPGYFRLYPAVLRATKGLSRDEFRLVLAVAMYDWLNGEGTFISNASLIELVLIDGTAGGERCIRRLISKLHQMGFIFWQKAKRSRANPTGRLLFLMPKAFGGEHPDPDSGVRFGPGHPGPVQSIDPDTQVRSRPDTQVRFKVQTGHPGPVQTGHPGPHDPDTQVRLLDSVPDQSPDSSSGREDDDLLRGLEGQIRAVVPKADHDPIVGALPGLVALARSKGADPGVVIGACVSKLHRVRSGNHAGFLSTCVEDRLDNPKPAQQAAPPLPVRTPTPDQTAAKLADRQAEDDRAKAEKAADRETWERTPAKDRAKVEKAVKRDQPHLTEPALRRAFEAACMIENRHRHQPGA